MNSKSVFISYAREDARMAEKIYHDLKRAGYEPWIDSADILPGRNWRRAIHKAMHECRFFLALLSENAVNKRGYVQKEKRMALNLLDEFPVDDIYIIPIRLEPCQVNDFSLKDLNWIDLFADYHAGFQKLLRSLGAGADEGGDTAPPFNVNTFGMAFVRLAPGVFQMGSPPDEPGRFDDETLHPVELTRGVRIQTTPITVGHWRRFTRETGFLSEAEKTGEAQIWSNSAWKNRHGCNYDQPGFDQSDDHPVTCISWHDAQAFIEWLNETENAWYRLPTEAEWEYACRGDTVSPFAFGKCLTANHANYDAKNPLSGCPKGPYRQQTTPVGALASNAWQLYDMHGNVWEWCLDWYDFYSENATIDPSGPETGHARVKRGGSWQSNARACRSAARESGDPSESSNVNGFRLVWVPD